MERWKVPTEHIHRADMAQGAGDCDLAIHDGPTFPVAACKTMPTPTTIFRREARRIVGDRPAGTRCHMLRASSRLARRRGVGYLATTGRGDGDRSGLGPWSGNQNGCCAGSCLRHGLRLTLRNCEGAGLRNSGCSCQWRDGGRRNQDCRWYRTIPDNRLRRIWHNSDSRQPRPCGGGCGKCLNARGWTETSECSWGKRLYRQRGAPRAGERGCGKGLDLRHRADTCEGLGRVRRYHNWW